MKDTDLKDMWNKLLGPGIASHHISEWNLSEPGVPVNVLLNQKGRGRGLAPPTKQLWAFLPIQGSQRAPVSQILSVFSSWFFSGTKGKSLVARDTWRQELRVYPSASGNMILIDCGEERGLGQWPVSIGRQALQTEGRDLEVEWTWDVQENGED